MRSFVPLLIAALLIAGAPASPAGAAEVVVSAAASLNNALKEIGAAYEKQTGQKVAFNFGASSALAQQIEQGAPVDLFFFFSRRGKNGWS